MSEAGSADVEPASRCRRRVARGREGIGKAPGKGRARRPGAGGESVFFGNRPEVDMAGSGRRRLQRAQSMLRPEKAAGEGLRRPARSMDASRAETGSGLNGGVFCPAAGFPHGNCRSFANAGSPSAGRRPRLRRNARPRLRQGTRSGRLPRRGGRRRPWPRDRRKRRCRC